MARRKRHSKCKPFMKKMGKAGKRCVCKTHKRLRILKTSRCKGR